RLDMRSPALDALRGALIACAATADLDDAQSFCEQVQAQLATVSLDGLRLSYVENLSLDDATYLWNETVASYELVHLSVEAKELEDSLAASMNEAVLQRLVEVKEALHKAQSRMTFAPAEAD